MPPPPVTSSSNCVPRRPRGREGRQLWPWLREMELARMQRLQFSRMELLRCPRALLGTWSTATSASISVAPFAPNGTSFFWRGLLRLAEVSRGLQHGHDPADGAHAHLRALLPRAARM